MGHFAFLNCSDFYVACERLFNPSLEGKPIIVLSNDRCVAACSQEADQLKIPLDVSYSNIKDFCSRHKVHVCLIDYKLYGELSQRMIDTLVGTGCEVEVCSMDEAFIHFPETMSVESVEILCMDVRQKIQKWTGLPAAIGLAPTKTLAKIANQKAQKNGFYVFSLCCSYERQIVLEAFPIEDVWGINENHLSLLRQLGVHTAQQFCDQDPLLIRQKMGNAAERTLWELRGLSCLMMEDRFLPKHSIAYSHSFDTPAADVEELSEALSDYTAMACGQLKEQKAQSRAVYLFLESASRYYSCAAALPNGVQDPNQVLVQAKSCLRKIYQKKEVYRKCGIVFVDLQPCDNGISFQKEHCPKRAHFNQALDSINAYFAKDAVYISERGSKHEWKTRSDKCTQYANSRSSLAFVKA